MPRYNVEYNGKWACFSSIVDAFVTGFMNKAEYEEWRIKEFGLYDYEPAEKCNMMSMEEAVDSIRFYMERDEAIEHLIKCGLHREVCEELISNSQYDRRTKREGKKNGQII